MKWYWHIESPLLSHFPHWRCPVNHAHIVTCWKLKPPRQLFICYFSSDIVATHQSVPICGDNKGGVTELVTVIRTKLRCHILLARGGALCSVQYTQGRGGRGEFLYSNCGHDNRSRQAVVSLCHYNSSQRFCRTQLYSQPQSTGLTGVPTSWGLKM